MEDDPHDEFQVPLTEEQMKRHLALEGKIDREALTSLVVFAKVVVLVAMVALAIALIIPQRGETTLEKREWMNNTKAWDRWLLTM